MNLKSFPFFGLYTFWRSSIQNSGFNVLEPIFEKAVLIDGKIKISGGYCSSYFKYS